MAFEACEARRLLAGDLVLTGAPFQNPDNPWDVNADQAVTVADAWQIVQALYHSSQPLSNVPAWRGYFADVNGDQVLSLADLAAEVDYLASRGHLTRSGESSAADLANPSGSEGRGGSGSENLLRGGSCSGNLDPVAVDDPVFSFAGEMIAVYWDNNDSDPESGSLEVVSVTQPSKGTVVIMNNQILFSAASDASGSDSFTYTIEDDCGAQDTATVTITYVAVTGVAVERQEVDGSWTSVPANEVSWYHDTLRWTPAYSPSSSLLTEQSIEWRKDDRSAVGRAWEAFAGAYSGDLADGSPGVGLWDIAPWITFSAPHQTDFSATMATPAVRDVFQISSIDWAEHTAVPAEAGELDTNDGVRFYPDATTSGGSARKKVDVVVQILPAVANKTVYLKRYDVDDPTDSDGPVDNDSLAQGDVNNLDNFASNNAVDPDIVLPASATTDANGQIRATFQINWIQPGNNFRIAAAARQIDLDRTKALADDGFSSLFYDADADSNFDNLASEVMLDETTDAHGMRVTPVLTVWRYLNVEVDSMWLVAGNAVQVNSNVPVVNHGNGTSTFLLQNALSNDDNNRFEGGTLTDSNNNVFNIRSNTQNSVLVDNLPGPIVPAQGNATLRDDDALQDGDDVPMPDMSELGAAMAEAFVTVVLEYNNNSVPFVLHASTSANDPNYFVNSFDWDSKSENSTGYWVAYVIGGFQGGAAEDNDPAGMGTAILGLTSLGNGGSIVYLETNRDAAVENGQTIAFWEQDTVVHEVGHAVGNSSAHPVTQWEVDGVTYSRYTEQYLKSIRTSDKPAG